jgi:hypothetical protein
MTLSVVDEMSDGFRNQCQECWRRLWDGFIELMATWDMKHVEGRLRFQSSLLFSANIPVKLMNETDLEETPQENDAGIWSQYRHPSDQRLRTFRFSLGLLAVLSVVLIALLFYGADPWVCTAWGVLVVALCTSLAAIDRQFAARLRTLENFLPSPNGPAAKKGESGTGSTDWQIMASARGHSRAGGVWPFYGAYTAFALLGLFGGTLPFWNHSIVTKPLAQTPGVQENFNRGFAPDRFGVPVTPIARPPYGNYRTPPALGNSQPGPGRPAYATPWANRPPFQTPARPQFPVIRPGAPPASPGAAPSTPPHSAPGTPSPSGQ